MIEDLHSRNLVRLLTADLDALVRKSLAPIRSEAFTLDIYFGRNLAARHDLLGRHIFDLLQAPLLQASFVRRNEVWQVKSVTPLAVGEIPAEHRAFVAEAARAYLSGSWPKPRRRPLPRFSLAILRDRRYARFRSLEALPLYE